MRENPDASMTHFERGDIEKWVHDVVCDTRLSEELSRMRTTSEPHTLDEVADAVDRRIVELSYGGFQGKHPLLYDVEPWHAFQLKSDHENHIEACASLPTLHKAVESAPIKAIAFHLARGNDFAAWAKNTLGDAELAGRLSAIQAKDAEDAKLKVSAILHERITELGG
jgi:hypothetical protein